MTKFLMLGLFLFVGTSAYADEDLVTQSGTWGTTCPAIVCSEPGDAWSYSFLTDSNVTYSSLYGALVTSVMDFQYSLNGVLDISVTGEYAALWFPQDNDGGFNLLNLPGLGSPIQFAQSLQLFTATGGYQCDLAEPCTIAPGTYDEPGPVGTEWLFGVADINSQPWSGGFIPGPLVTTPNPLR